MDQQKIEQIFENELKLIDDNIRLLALDVLSIIDDDFFIIPTSTTGKYHPMFCNRKHGLILHTKLVCAYAKVFTGFVYGKDNKHNLHLSIIIAACLLHDIGKKARYHNYKIEYVNHPLVASDILQSVYKRGELIYQNIEDDIIQLLVDGINLHGGIYSPVEVLKPMKDFSLHQLIIYFADNMASQKNQNKENWMEQQLDKISSII